MRIVPKLSPEAIELLKLFRDLKRRSNYGVDKGLTHSLYAVYTHEPYINTLPKNPKEDIKCSVRLRQDATPVDSKLFGPPYLPSPFKLDFKLEYQGFIMINQSDPIHKYLRSQCFKDMLDNVFMLPKIENELGYSAAYLVKLFTSNVLEAGSRKFYANNDEKLVEVKHASDIDISSLLSFRKLIIIDEFAKQSSHPEAEEGHRTENRNEALSIAASYLLEDNVYILFNPFSNIIDQPHIALEYADEIALLLRHVYYNVDEDFFLDYFRAKSGTAGELVERFTDLLGKMNPYLSGNEVAVDEKDVQAYFYYIEHFKKNKEIVSPQIILFE